MCQNWESSSLFLGLSRRGIPTPVERHRPSNVSSLGPLPGGTTRNRVSGGISSAGASWWGETGALMLLIGDSAPCTLSVEEPPGPLVRKILSDTCIWDLILQSWPTAPSLPQHTITLLHYWRQCTGPSGSLLFHSSLTHEQYRKILELFHRPNLSSKW